MKKENEFFSLRRFSQLLKYDFNNNRLYYIATVPIAMLIMALLFWYVFPDLPKSTDALYASPGWRSKNYIPMLFLGYIIFGIFIVGKSFPSFRNSGSVTSFLTLPASTFEKYLVQWIIRIALFLVLYPLIFQITANVTADLYLENYKSFLLSNNLPMDKLPGIDKFRFFDLFGDANEATIGRISIICMGVLGASLLFLGSTIFKKWNLFFGPLSILVMIFFIYAYLCIVSYFIVPEQSDFWVIGFKGNQPAYFDEEIPLIGLSALIIAAIGAITCWLATYFRLKEKQV
ncbi:hypothetical protein [Echinicola rosea]|uniref:ABC transporter permease n=1 Tax=Echinicola rosea TaxID=1807691 RepID=A0ABQ1UTZ0_9BACT|nr:hypothetical protein [Echinicola rosea]GGF26123.1 hypothetical protein GCM10011339_12730 [Echinicola rosea]